MRTLMTRLAALVVALLLVSCGSEESCFERATNRPVSEGGCQGLEGEALDLCLDEKAQACEEAHE